MINATDPAEPRPARIEEPTRAPARSPVVPGYTPPAPVEEPTVVEPGPSEPPDDPHGPPRTSADHQRAHA